MTPEPKLTRAFYAADTEQVARALLGMHLVHHVDGVARRARIVEVEAYVGTHDLASHSSKGLTPRTRAMFGEPGHAYIYLVYGMHHCMNVVTEPAGRGAAVLLRAVEPIANVAGNTRGPGLLCRAMGLNLSHNRQDLLGDALYIVPEPVPKPFSVLARPRVGVHYAGAWAEAPLRFSIAGNPFVSRS
jgi:DNA-3-methyladenine glycosylase